MKYVLSVVGIIIFGVIAVILFARSVTNTSQTTQIGKEQTHTTDYINDNSRVEYIRNGAVVSNEQRRTLKISVTEKERTIEVLKGYDELVEKRETFTNNQNAYYVFMNALDHAGFTREKVTKVSNPVGYCSTGSTYFYILHDLGNQVSSLWNSSCDPLGGNLGNNGNTIRQLFTNQIPNYNKFIQGVNFNGTSS